MIEAIIFDMDGLLIDSELYWDRARLELAAEVNAPWSTEDHLAIMGTNTQEWSEYMIRRMDLQMSWPQVRDEIVGRMTALYRAAVPFMPGAVEAVDLARTLSRVALASGSDRGLIDIVTAEPVMAGKFEVILSADEVGAGKPAPDVYLAAAAGLGIDPAACLCLEDSANGILSGKAAGMRVIAVPDPRFPPRRSALTQADVVISSLNEFDQALIERLSTT